MVKIMRRNIGLHRQFLQRNPVHHPPLIELPSQAGKGFMIVFFNLFFSQHISTPFCLNIFANFNESQAKIIWLKQNPPLKLKVGELETVEEQPRLFVHSLISPAPLERSRSFLLGVSKLRSSSLNCGNHSKG